MIVKNEVGKGTLSYVFLTFIIFLFVISSYYFSDELGINKYLKYIVLVGVILYFVVFFQYRKFVIKSSEKENTNNKTKQPWE